jgi:hypothetical protein
VIVVGEVKSVNRSQASDVFVMDDGTGTVEVRYLLNYVRKMSGVEDDETQYWSEEDCTHESSEFQS